MTVAYSGDARTHKIKEWTGKQAGTEGKTPGKVAVPPVLADAIVGWREYGDTDISDAESFIFPTRSGTCIIPTNWAEDVHKPAGKKAGLPNVSYHWFRRGQAAVQHHQSVPDQQTVDPVDPETWKAVVNLERLVEPKKGGSKSK